MVPLDEHSGNKSVGLTTCEPCIFIQNVLPIISTGIKILSAMLLKPVLTLNVSNNAAWPHDTSNIEAVVTPLASLLEVPL